MINVYHHFSRSLFLNACSPIYITCTLYKDVFGATIQPVCAGMLYLWRRSFPSVFLPVCEKWSPLLSYDSSPPLSLLPEKNGIEIFIYLFLHA